MLKDRIFAGQNKQMNELLTFFILAFTSFFSLINPLGTMPIFMTMTSELTTKHRTHTAKKASIVAFFIILLFAFSGQVLFKFFGISVNSFRVVGGVIFFLMGMDMLQARLGKVKVKDSEVKTYVNDISITPLAIPMICGPGAITNAIVLMEDATEWPQKTVLILAIFCVILLTYIILYSSSRIMKLLGETGNNVMMRLMGLIVMVIAVEFFFSGLKPILQDIL
jgi:multiple antibiotic resistance protein